MKLKRQIPGQPLVAWYNLRQGPAVKKHWPRKQKT
jgi:hypothetical protein